MWLNGEIVREPGGEAVTKIIRSTTLALLVIAGPATGRAQDAPTAGPDVVTPQMASQSTSKALVPLKVVLTLARYQGDKRISSAPYTLWVTANDPRTTSLQMGVEMPVSSGPSVNYRSVGTNVECNASAGPGAMYKLGLKVSDSSVTFAERDKASSADAQPSFRSFHSTFNILLRDGQTAQYTTATDPVSGEVTKIDIALTVLK
jgi:hypothetical protein